MGVVFGGTDNSNSPLYGPRQPFDGGSGPNTTQIKDKGVKTGTFTIRADCLGNTMERHPNTE